MNLKDLLEIIGISIYIILSIIDKFIYKVPNFFYIVMGIISIIIILLGTVVGKKKIKIELK